MNILHILNYAAPYRGNLMNSIYALKSELEKSNNKLVFLFPNNAKELYWINDLINSGNNVYFKSDSVMKNYRVLKHIVVKHKIDIVHTHFWNLKDCANIRMLKMRTVKLKSIIHHHNHYAVSKSFIREKIKRFIISSDAHIGCSNDVTLDLINKGFKKEICFNIDNAIDFNRLNFNKPFDISLLDIKKNSKIFLLFGFDFYRKGVDIVISSMKEIACKYNLILAIVVSVNLDKVKNQIKQYLDGDIPSWIRFLPPRDDIAAYYCMADCFISASREEGFCYAIIEAAYCNCQSIISRIPGHRTDVPEIKTFENENTEQLKEKILLVINETSDVTRNINQLQKYYVIEAYGLNKWINGVITVYNNILGK